VLIVLIGHGPIAFIGGGPGVTVFFTLSGFLITALLLEERRANGVVDLRRFYARRALRLLPALAVFLVLVGILLARRHESLTGVWLAALYVANLAGALGRRMGHLGHTWSLSLEEQFYVVWPVSLILLARSGRRWAAVAGAVTGAAVCAGLRIFVEVDAVARQALPVRVLFFALWRADALLVGCVLALLLGPALRVPRRVLALAGTAGVVVVLVAALQATSDGYLTGWMTAVPFATAAVVLSLLAGHPHLSRVLELRPLRYTGRISYGLYLWHFPLFLLLRPRLDGLPAVVEIAIGVAASYAAAALSFSLVETPFLRLKRRYAAGRRRPAVVEGPGTGRILRHTVSVGTSRGMEAR
jgi:peptidoglycan/LPS O-acetylase OafA/YrhL